jgi:hypothetical protein
MEDIAASTGLDPLDWGVLEAICDFRLDGIPALTVAEVACCGTEGGSDDVSGSLGVAGCTTGALGVG